jgi:multiple sugar transport system ATP-binding protein
MTVVVVEPTGSETQVVLRLGDKDLICLLRERIAVRAGAALPVTVEPQFVHLFDGTTRRRLD